MTVVPSRSAQTSRRSNPLLIPIALLAIIAAAAAAWFLKPAPPEPEKPVRKYDIASDTKDADLGYTAPQISPDGSMVAYVFDSKLFIRDLNAFEPREVPESRRVNSICWSPDSKQLAYIASSNTVVKYDVTSGGSVEIGRITSSGVTGSS